MSTTTEETNYLPKEIVNYPIPCDPEGGALFIYGNANAKNMALMCAGFPDDQTIFAPFASRLAINTDTLVGVMCLPGYENRKEKPWTEHKRDKKDGYSFDEMASCMREAAKALRSESSLPSKPKFTGIFHDWGVVPAAIWSNREIADCSDNAPDQLVYFDVLPNPHPSYKTDAKENNTSTFHQYIAGTYYQLMLALAFVLQRFLANALAVICLIIGSLIMALFKIQPTLQLDADIINNKSPPCSITHVIYMCYPYKNCYKNLSSVDWSKNNWKVEIQDNTLPEDLSKVPVLYMYGTEKRTHFHNDVPLKILEKEHDESKNKSNAIAVDNAGHYLYIQKPDICFDAVRGFMENE